MFELTLSGNSLAYDIEYNDFYMALYFPSYGARINLGAFFATPISTVKFPCSRLECRHHASRRLVEQPAHKPLHYCRAKLEVDEKIEKTALFVGFENPVIIEITERAFLVGNVDAPCSAGILIRGVQHIAGRKAFPEHFKTDDDISHQLVSFTAFNAHGQTPRQEF